MRKLNVTDGLTDRDRRGGGGGALQYLPSPGLWRRREIIMMIFVNDELMPALQLYTINTQAFAGILETPIPLDFM